MVDRNRRVPPLDLESKKKLRHQYVFHQQNDAGKVTMEYFDPKDMQMTTSFVLEYNGSYYATQPGINESLNTDQVNQYNSKGSGTFTDGNINQTGESTMNQSMKGDASAQSGETNYGGAQKNVGGAKEGGTVIIQDDIHTVAKNNVTTTIEGSYYRDVMGAEIKTVFGNKHTTIEKDNGIVVSVGNMDTTVMTGRYRVYSKDFMKLESETSILLKVGSSTIFITPSDITIKSKSIKFVKAE